MVDFILILPIHIPNPTSLEKSFPLSVLYVLKIKDTNASDVEIKTLFGCMITAGLTLPPLRYNLLAYWNELTVAAAAAQSAGQAGGQALVEEQMPQGE
ncbi:MAG: hypothetical protein ABGX27_06595 [Desulfurobacteriaceae bacterium]